MIPDVSAISGDGLAQAYRYGFFVYPDVNLWEWVSDG